MKTSLMSFVLLFLLVACGSEAAKAGADTTPGEDVLADAGPGVDTAEDTIPSTDTKPPTDTTDDHNVAADTAGPDLPGPDTGEDTIAPVDTLEDTGGEPLSCDVSNPDYTVGLKLCKPGVADGYILYPVKHRAEVYLIDRLGRVVHKWGKSKFEPGQSCYLRPNGNLLRTAMPKGQFSIGGGEGGRLEEYDWDDNLVWAFDYASATGMTHHDIALMPNGNVLMLAVEKKDAAAAALVGFEQANLKEGYVAPELVIEVKKTGATTFEVVWQWHVWDHLIQDSKPALANYGDPKAHPELLRVTGNVPAFWNHANSIKYSPELDQIIISARSHNEFWVIDHSTTTAQAASHQGGAHNKGGDFLYRWGNPAEYGGGTKSDQKLFQQHDAQWIEPGCPGAGNILVYNNGLGRPDGAYSTVDELVPAVEAGGSYPAPAAGKAWGPASLAWQYKATPPTAFYSAEISGTQRLPNGNTLICEGLNGRLFEVTAAGEKVWEFVNPVMNSGPMSQYEVAPLDVKQHVENAVFKGHWYPKDFSGFAGRTLTPGPVIEDDDTVCPVDNVNYVCSPTCANGAQNVSQHFTCAASGTTCCFKQIQNPTPPKI